MASYLFDKLNYPGFKNIPGAVYTRSGVEYQQNAAGVWTPFDDDVPPISSGVGVDVWEARTNSIRNPTFLGGAAGSPGTLPTNFGISGVDTASIGVTRTLAFGTEDGLPYMEVSLVGTPSSSLAAGIYLDAGSTITVANGQTWTNSIFARSVGAVLGVSFQQGVVGRTSGNTVSENFVAVVAMTAVRTRFPQQVTFADATTAYAQITFSCVFTAGVPVNVTYRLYAPQMKLGADLNDPPILQTNNAAATRGAPSMYINAPHLLNAPFTLQVWANMANIDGTLRRFAVLAADTGENNQIALERTAGNQFAIQSVVAGVGQTRAAFLAGYTGARLVKMAVRVGASTYRASVDGTLMGEVSASIPSMSRIILGTRASLGNAPLNGAITRFQIINRDISDTELVNLTV